MTDAVLFCVFVLAVFVLSHFAGSGAGSFDAERGGHLGLALCSGAFVALWISAGYFMAKAML